MRIFLLVLLLTSVAFAKDNPKYDSLFRKRLLMNLKQEQYWFDQVLDHYNYNALTNKEWKQRYWVIKDYFNPKVGPVFLFICGEWTCTGIPEGRSWTAVLAQKTQGLVLTL